MLQLHLPCNPKSAQPFGVGTASYSTNGRRIQTPLKVMCSAHCQIVPGVHSAGDSDMPFCDAASIPCLPHQRLWEVGTAGRASHLCPTCPSAAARWRWWGLSVGGTLTCPSAVRWKKPMAASLPSRLLPELQSFEGGSCFSVRLGVIGAAHAGRHTREGCSDRLWSNGLYQDWMDLILSSRPGGLAHQHQASFFIYEYVYHWSVT